MNHPRWGCLIALGALLVACAPKVPVSGTLGTTHASASPTAAAPSPTPSAPSSSVTATENGGKTLVHTQNVVGTEFWDAAHVHLVEGTIDVDAPLTIAPGATVDFSLGAGLVVAPAGTGSLIASGSPGLPITFDSAATSPSPGDWCGIDVGSSAAPASSATGDTCVLDHVVLAHAGEARPGQPTPQPGVGWAAIHVFKGSVLSITNSTVSASAGTGLQLDVAALQSTGTLDQFGKNAFVTDADYPIQVDPDLVGKLDTATTFSGDGTESVRLLALGGELTEIRQPQTWPKLTQDGNASNSDVVPYSWPLALSSVEAKEILDPGVHVLFDLRGLMRIYEFGEIDAEGTSVDPVIFDSINSLNGTAKPGDWEGLRFLCCQDELHNVFILHAGYGGLLTGYNADLGLGNLAGQQTLVTLDNVFLWLGSGVGLAYDTNTDFLADNVNIDPHPDGATKSVSWY